MSTWCRWQVIVACLVAVPPTTAAPADDRKESDRRERELFLAECKENELKFLRAVKANPRDTKAWALLGWNAASNLATTTDDVAGRYAHVRRGIEYLLEGVEHNPTDVELCVSVGFHLSHSVDCGDTAGRSNRAAGRALFRQDAGLHKLLAAPVDWKGVAGPDGLPDPFLAARRWHERAVALFDKHPPPADTPMSVTPIVLRTLPAVSLRAHAMALEDEGDFSEAAADAWTQAGKMWAALGECEFPARDGTKFRLKDNEAARASVNYDYWKEHCEAESTELVLAARRAARRARQYLAKHDADFGEAERGEARDLCDRAFRAWVEVGKKHPRLLADDRDLQALVVGYQSKILNGQPLPGDSPLRQLLSLSPPKR